MCIAHTEQTRFPKIENLYIICTKNIPAKLKLNNSCLSRDCSTLVQGHQRQKLLIKRSHTIKLFSCFAIHQSVVKHFSDCCHYMYVVFTSFQCFKCNPFPSDFGCIDNFVGVQHTGCWASLKSLCHHVFG